MWNRCLRDNGPQWFSLMQTLRMRHPNSYGGRTGPLFGCFESRGSVPLTVGLRLSPLLFFSTPLSSVMSYEHRKEWGRGRGGRGRGFSSHYEAGSSRESGGVAKERPPPHLRGREIGLWYARRQGQKSKDKERMERPVVRMDESREKQITRLLNSVQAQSNDVKQEPCAEESWWATENERNSAAPQIKLESDTVRDAWDDDDEDEKVSECCLGENRVNAVLNRRLKEELQEKRNDYRYLEMQRFREMLPSYNMKEEIIKVIHGNQVTVISGETGCGKTTQVTQFLLDDYINKGKGSSCHIVCTQPRRISAISVAERVAAERSEPCGRGNSIGYQIRLESQLPRKQGSILYCTTGIVLQWLQSDQQLASVSHVVIDEVHERNLQSDMLMAIVKDLLKCRPDLKVILMSATLNAEKFSQYFDNCPMLHIPGLTFPVKEYLLEDVLEMVQYSPKDNDCRPHSNRRFMQGRTTRPEKAEKEEIYRERFPNYLRHLQEKYSESTVRAVEYMNDEKVNLELIAELIRHIVLRGEDGAILVFLPGWDNISTLNDLLLSQVMFKSDRFIIIPLHSLMPTVNQTQVFKTPPPGVRKIVIATNIAETSITIDDVVHVIDGGKLKETNYDTQNNIRTMTAEWVSHASAKQRKGRAGRVKPGYCYHLYNSLRDTLLDDYQLPEIVRTPLEELCLQIKILGLGGIASFLQKVMDPPSREAIILAITHLMGLNALDKREELTPLGFHLARLPVEPHIGKMILFGALFCCLDPVLTIAASLSFKDPFVVPLGKDKLADVKRKELSQNTKSDHLTVLNAFRGWEKSKQWGPRAEREYCWEYFLSTNTLKMLGDMKGQFAEHLLGAGFVSSRRPKDPKSNINSDNEKLIKAVMCAGLYPKVAKIRTSYKRKGPTVKISTKADGKVCIHPKSVNVEEREYHHSWLVYHLKMKTSSIYLYDCTEVSPYSLLFFGGDISIQKDQDQDTIAVDEWIVFQSPARIAHLVKDLRTELDSLLKEKIEKPQAVDWNDTKSRDCAVLSAIIDLITTQEGGEAKDFDPRFRDAYYR
ncbi:LOW QUALITY PROTEIN: ATP-dependent DNA/RNA helicase DHX36 [Rhinoderma darwinii]|uniref:LOW QUALITY PROTEIN: ATP-dependent DNA/RNA helicase DHX36 n=1 Tax=Rhinoderma darwinii TaxID=43563 RepID=UPI003F663A0F